MIFRRVCGVLESEVREGRVGLSECRVDGGTWKIYPSTGREWSGNEGNVESVLYMRWGCVEEMRER